MTRVAAQLRSRVGYRRTTVRHRPGRLRRHTDRTAGGGRRPPGTKCITPQRIAPKLIDLVAWQLRRATELIIQGYYDAGYRRIFVPADDPGRRVDFMLSRLPVAAV